MNKVFLDCGAHCGCSRRFFQEKIDPLGEFQIYSFEPDPEFNKFCPDLINKAVGTTNRTVPFYKFRLAGGSSLSKLRADKLSPKLFPYSVIQTEEIDLDEFIKAKFEQTDYIILKLDIEGEEYNLLPHLFEKGSIHYIDELYIEYHNHRVDVSYDVDAELNKKVADLGIKTTKWDAMVPPYCIGKNR